MMKRIILAAVFVALLGSVSWSADFQKGVAAAKSGDYATALREWKPLAEQGDANAQFVLGVMYEKGQGVPQDYKAAVKWYSLAAEQGDVMTQKKLARMYEKGEGVPKDYKTAAKWYRHAAEQGDAIGQFNLGLMYFEGRGVPENDVYAHMWINLAATNGVQDGAKARDIVAELMSPSQIKKAKKLARECIRKKYKGC
jgi:TPR repeat protein